MATTKKAVKKTVKKAAPKKVAKKSAPKKATKTATKKVAVKKEAAKKPGTGNKALDLMLAKIKTATSNGEKSVVVFTTSKEDHKLNTPSGGFGVTDLKPKLVEAYKHLFCQFDLTTKPVSLSELKVEWIVNIKK